MEKPICKSNPTMKCVATRHCYKETYLKNHSCSGCCKEYIESLKTFKVKSPHSL
jgi:hypothetical protein